MGRARIIYKCGHVGKLILFGNSDDEHRLIAESEKLCSACWVEEQIKIVEKKKKKKLPYKKDRRQIYL